ncbi:hypothetical protein SAMN05518871_109133 [Psychrobacillus sp. OK028]|uniref:hypothetical protein n=1 Tax=Psychrobacillus sp. OK028 TaxID=1884359 RepID=UPI00088E83A0|nr:hypothetical protein [Psychrobacillus sp. OK028]SDO02387.1 hypothetical protein SAMN05518871_109133 [Psychrobacillus sp. OK028]
MVIQNCYWCENEANSMEHVPPRCLFPEDKDVKRVFNKTFREHLITVPSCDEHNMQKSNLDEYLMVTLSGRVGNNGLAYIQTLTKIDRSRKRNRKLLDIENSDVIRINDKEFPVLWVNVDTQKLNHSFESIARGLYYYENSKSFKGELTIVSKLFNHMEDPDGTEYNIRSSEIIEIERRHWNTEVKGENKEVFSYQFSPFDDFKTQTLALNFFEGIDVFVILTELTAKEIEDAKSRLSFLNKLLFGDLQLKYER